MIGFIGLGIMGEPMCLNVIRKSGQDVIVYDVNEEQMEKLHKAGAIKATSVKDLGEKSDVIISMVPKSEHVEAVYKELIPVVKEGQILIDMSTISPEVSKALSEMVKEKGAIMLDAPVVKSRPAAEAGLLGIYVGGDIDAFNKVEEILRFMGSNIIHLGDNGSGLVMKLCHNMLVAQIQNGVNEAITLATKANIDISKLMTSISYGGGQNFYLDSKGKSIEKGDFTTAFSVENMYKDIYLAKELAEDFGLVLNGIDVVKEVYDKAMAESLGKEDFSATIKIVNR